MHDLSPCCVCESDFRQVPEGLNARDCCGTNRLTAHPPPPPPQSVLCCRYRDKRNWTCSVNNACVSVRALEQSGLAAGLDVDVRYTHAEDLKCEVQDLSTFVHATFWNRIPSTAWVNGLVSDNGGCWSESWFTGCTRFRRITQRVRLGRLSYSLWLPFIFVSVTFWTLYDALVGCSIRLLERVWWTVVESTDLSNFFFTPSVECVQS